jgi:acyl-[acyl-carrier-protein]-phospholipid O-acyltransferase/long-chain-fatty-acid--[acyl-carrier-protein] ligase
MENTSPNPDKMSASGYKGLLKSLGFQSFLWTQFLGAFNDNVFKIVLSMIAVNLATDGSGGGYVSMVGAVFILPFFIFSGYAGYVSDVFNKRTVLIITKAFEIVAVTVGFFAFWSGRIELMLATLFLMAVHSTFFSPAKYGIVPEMLPDSELSRANGLLEMSTFFAIIIGTSAGTIMYSALKGSLPLVGVFLMAIAVLGTVMSFGIPRVPSSGAKKKFSLSPWSEIGQGFRSLMRTKLLLFTVGGITYFWFMGSLLQMDILLLGKEVMGLSDFWVGILITFLAIGIGVGSIVAGRLSGDKVEPGLVPLGSIGMGLFSILLACSPESYPRTAAAMIMLGFCGGLFIVPLNALLQQKSGAEEKGRVIATNNFVNTVGILLASGVLWLMTEFFHISADKIILGFGVLTLVATVWMFKALPGFLLRFVLWMLTHTLYNIKIVGQKNVPLKGPAILVSNHMSFVDAFLVGACVQRFIRFMIYEYFYEIKAIQWLLRLMKAIPIADGNRREVLKSLAAAREELKAGHMVCIFAEGAITRTGNLLPFKKGFERIAEGLDVPIIPVHLDRVWGSIFSFKGLKFFWKLPTHFPYPVTVSFGEPMVGAKAHEVRQAVMELGSQALGHRRVSEDLLHIRFIKTARKRLFSLCMADSTGKKLSWIKALAASFALSRWMGENCKTDTAAIMLPATVGGALANIACLMAGKTSVNLNFIAGKDAVSSALSQCGADKIVTSRAFIEKTGFEADSRMVFLEDVMKEISTLQWLSFLAASLILPAKLLSALFCQGRPDPDKLATIIFTSGSTGEPKGVMLSHHNIVSNIEGFQQIFHVSAEDTILGTLPFFHAFGYTATIWFPLLTGFPAVYHPNPMDARGVGELARTRKATLLIGTPTFYNAYIKKCQPGDFSHLRYAIAGAEKLKTQTASEFKARFHKDLLEGYGCTEMGPAVSVNVHDVEDGSIRQQGRRPGTVGHPIPGVSVKVVDQETGEPVAPGTGGMLLVKGPSLMLGYYKNPEATARVMQDGWYVTGDIASVGEDGFITILDRVSRFSKIGGEMVPHVKIEEALASVLGCDCAVTSVEDRDRGERIYAFYTRCDLAPNDAWSLLAATGLPRLWLPKKENIVRLDELPASPTGKLDLKKVKEMALELAGA